MRTYSDDIRETAELLAAARVAVYPVDARGLMTRRVERLVPAIDQPDVGTTSGNRSGSRRSVTANRPSTAIDDMNATKQLMKEAASMQQIAEQTGGQEYLNTNGLKEAVASAVENGSSYYSVSYVPAAKQLDGKFRKIEVRVDNGRTSWPTGAGITRTQTMEHRNTTRQNEPDCAATMHGAPPSTEIQFEARALAATDPLLLEPNYLMARRARMRLR